MKKERNSNEEVLASECNENGNNIAFEHIIHSLYGANSSFGHGYSHS